MGVVTGEVPVTVVFGAGFLQPLYRLVNDLDLWLYAFGRNDLRNFIRDGFVIKLVVKRLHFIGDVFLQAMFLCLAAFVSFVQEVFLVVFL